MKKIINHKLIAKTITDQMLSNITKTLLKGQCPDLYWNLEIAIEDATKYVEKVASDNTRLDLRSIVEEFDNEKVPSDN